MFLALLLVLAELDAVQLPGCGTASDCTRAAASRWGKLPGTEWPLSFAGFAYFQALLAAFLFCGGRLPALLRGIVFCGAAASVLLTAVMFAEDYVCGYCVTIHSLNVAFAFGYEWRERRWTPGNAPRVRGWDMIGVFAATGLAASALLAVIDRQADSAARQSAADGLQTALRQATADPPVGAAGISPGRYYLGPKSAPVHVVVVSDYQCPSCREIDAQLRSMIAGREDVSVSARHFPFCTDCNAHIDKTRHANACRAALAAEAAGQVGGADAFWRMHDWLFEHRGEFDELQMQQFVQEVNLDWESFYAAMHGADALAVIRQDAAAADAAGLQFTPMVFINGVAIDPAN
jgi:protein-disulfide isomerase